MSFKMMLGFTLLVMLFGAEGVHGKVACSPSPLTRSEAENLLMKIPEAIATETAGGKLDVIAWNPGPSFRHDLFYFFQLFTNTNTPPTLLDNGMLGYFAVNKVTGSVVDGILGDNTVESKALAKAQAKVRVRHCVPHDLVLTNESISPFRE